MTETTEDAVAVDQAFIRAEVRFRQASRHAIVDLPEYRLREFERLELAATIVQARTDERERFNAVLRACNGVLSDAKMSLDFADQVLVSRVIVGELRQALRECMNV